MIHICTFYPETLSGAQFFQNKQQHMVNHGKPSESVDSFAFLDIAPSQNYGSNYATPTQISLLKRLDLPDKVGGTPDGWVGLYLH